MYDTYILQFESETFKKIYITSMSVSEKRSTTSKRQQSPPPKINEGYWQILSQTNIN